MAARKQQQQQAKSTRSFGDERVSQSSTTAQAGGSESGDTLEGGRRKVDELGVEKGRNRRGQSTFRYSQSHKWLFGGLLEIKVKGPLVNVCPGPQQTLDSPRSAGLLHNDNRPNVTLCAT